MSSRKKAHQSQKKISPARAGGTASRECGSDVTNTADTGAAGRDNPGSPKVSAADVKTASKTVEANTLFLPYQRERILDTSRYMIDEKARRIGLTFGYAYKYTRKMALSPTGKTWYTANDSSTVLEFIDYIGYFGRLLNSFFDVYEEGMIVDEDEILTKVVRFKDGGKVIGLSSNPTALHGKGGHVIGDEFAYHKQASTMWEAMQATAGWGDDIVLLSTHTSEDSPYNQHVKKAQKLYTRAAELGIEPRSEAFRRLSLDMGLLPWSYRRTTIEDAVAQGLVEKINSAKGLSYTREDFLKECRAKCETDEQWQRQYMCVPSSDSSALLPYHLILSCVDEKALRPLETCTNIYQGVDFARRRDLTSVMNGENMGDVLWLREKVGMEKTAWRTQLARISDALMRPKFARGCYDQTGMGDMPVEELQQVHGAYKVSGVVFTNDIKANLAMNLYRRFEDRRIRIPYDQALFSALNKIRKSTTATGKIMFEAEHDEAGHADEFWALALLNEAATNREVPGTFA
ncbi:MAG: hypothetical protein JWM16_4188, partial [Verrucomicrobiales bacterium]|nr:hypothetical protein [Verrucomicrobiales bacterium]